MGFSGRGKVILHNVKITKTVHWAKKHVFDVWLTCENTKQISEFHYTYGKKRANTMLMIWTLLFLKIRHPAEREIREKNDLIPPWAETVAYILMLVWKMYLQKQNAARLTSPFFFKSSWNPVSNTNRVQLRTTEKSSITITDRFKVAPVAWITAPVTRTQANVDRKMTYVMSCENPIMRDPGKNGITCAGRRRNYYVKTHFECQGFFHALYLYPLSNQMRWQRAFEGGIYSCMPEKLRRIPNARKNFLRGNKTHLIGEQASF